MKRIISVLMCAVLIMAISVGCTAPTGEVVVSPEVERLVRDTCEMCEIVSDLSTAEEIILSHDEEMLLEKDAVVAQENISYGGTAKGSGKKLLGKSVGLTYYSQADSRWADKPYTITGSKSQTMRSSGCGPTAAAIVVTSSKGAILPVTMAKLFVDNGYRTRNNGTAWSCWSFVADYFGFREYHNTASFSTMLTYLKQDKNSDGVADYLVVASCDYGLFTTGGHYVVLVADKSGTLTVYDPYYYKGKYNTASRKGAGVRVNGTTAYVTEQAFRKYANTKQFWIFSNDYQSPKQKPATTKPTTAKPVVKYKTTVGKKYRLKKRTVLYSKPDLSGVEYDYLAKTQIVVLAHYNANVDRVRVVKTGRVAYCKVSAYA